MSEQQSIIRQLQIDYPHGLSLGRIEELAPCHQEEHSRLDAYLCCGTAYYSEHHIHPLYHHALLDNCPFSKMCGGQSIFDDVLSREGGQEPGTSTGGI